MTADLAKRSHAVFMGALELAARERRQYIEAECAGDEALRGRVERLVAALDHTRGFLETPALECLSEPPEPEPIERQVGGYKTIRVIGTGGMATVYEAMQEQPRRRVALKVMRRGLIGSSAVHRFQYETEVLGQLQHPGIAQIYEAGAADDGLDASTPFFALEYIADAATITDYVEARGLTLRERFAMLADVCDAVHHGHQHGVIHRDLKPGNILVDEHGKPKVIDFGVARSIETDRAWITRETDTGKIIGTLNYMSPEQCRGDSGIDTRTDVYSLGVVLYQLVCGRLPHDLNSAPIPRAMQIIERDAPARPSSYSSAADSDVDAIVLRAIDKDPDRRYQSAAALGADLRRYLNHLAIEARPPTVFYQCRMFARRNRALVTAGAAVMLAVASAAVVSTGFAYRATKESGRRQVAEQRAIAERDQALWQSYIANIVAAFSALQNGEYQLLRTRLASAPAVHRGWEWRMLDGLADRSSATIDAHEDMILAFAANADGSLLATGCRDGTVSLWTPGGTRLQTREGRSASAPLALAFTRDGRHIITGGFDGGVRALDIGDGLAETLIGSQRDLIHSVSCGPDGVIATASERGEAKLWRPGADPEARDLPTQPGGVWGVTFSPSGDRLATWGKRGLVRIRDAVGTDSLAEFDFGGLVEVVVFSPDGQLIAVGGEGGRIELWNPTTRETLHSLQTPYGVGTVRSLAFSPSGQTLAAGQVDRSLTVWSVADGEQRSRLRGHGETVSGLWFRPDGNELLSASWDRTIRIWELEDESPAAMIPTLRGHTGSVLSTAFSPGGQLLASGSADRTARLWDPVRGQEIGQLGKHSGAVYCVRFSSDGGRVVTGDGSGAVRVWNANTGELVAEYLREHVGAVWTAEFSPDNTLLTSSGDGGIIRVRRLGHDGPPMQLRGHENRVDQLAISPDSRLLASGSRDHSVRIWDLTTGEQLHRLDFHRSDVFSVCFSRDGERLYSGSRDQTVAVWDPRSGEREAVLEGHGQFITSLVLSPDGTRLAGSSWFGEILLWDTDTLDMVGSFKGHDEVVRALAFHPSGRWLVSGSHDQTMRLFDTATATEKAQARHAMQRDRVEAEPIIANLLAEHASAAEAIAALLGRQDLAVGVRAQAHEFLLARALHSE